MSSRLALESWQLLFPAIGIGIFAAVFFAVVIRVWRMRSPAVDHLGHLPLEEESVAGATAAPPRVDAGPIASLGRNPPRQCSLQRTRETTPEGVSARTASFDSRPLKPGPEAPAHLS
jgi:hypothetical protein